MTARVIEFVDLSPDQGVTVVRKHGTLDLDDVVEALEKRPPGADVVRVMRACDVVRRAIRSDLVAVANLAIREVFLKLSARTGVAAAPIVLISTQPHQARLDWVQPQPHAPIGWVVQTFARTHEVGDVLLQIGDEVSTTAMVQATAPEAEQHAARERRLARTALPKESDASVTLRRELSKDWLTSKEVAQQLDSTAKNKSQHARDLRERGKLLGVWSPSAHGYLHPPCQIRNHRVLKVIAELLPILPADDSGWTQADWLYSPHTDLKGRCPAELLADAPDAVITAATREYREGPHARW